MGMVLPDGVKGPPGSEGYLHECFTVKPNEGFVWAVPKREINRNNLEWHNRRYPAIGIMPSGGVWMKGRCVSARTSLWRVEHEEETTPPFVEQEKLPYLTVGTAK